MVDVPIYSEGGEIIESPNLDDGYISYISELDADTSNYAVTHGIYRAFKPGEKEAANEQKRRKQIEAAAALFVMNSAANMSDDDAQDVSMLFPEWQVGGDYEQGDILRYNDALYRVGQKVTGAQADHTPDKAVSLYKKIGEPTGGLFPWSQPQGAHDAYKKGDKVSHKGKTWVSTVDSNVWEPGVYGWEEAKE